MSYGELSGIPIGSTFWSRRSLYNSGVHRDIRRDICGGSPVEGGAESVLFATRSPEDIDLGQLIYFAGEGTRDNRGLPIADQDFVGLNKLLASNIDSGEPVRVIRAITQGFVYSGLFIIEDAILRLATNDVRVCQFRMRELRDARGTVIDRRKTDSTERRSLSTHYRLLRNAKVPETVKRLYDYRCQVCGIRIDTLAGPYSEGAHIVPLGGGANGPDIKENVLSLCPNHHVMLDHGSIYLADDWSVKDRDGSIIATLDVHAEHGLLPIFASQHRALMGFVDE